MRYINEKKRESVKRLQEIKEESQELQILQMNRLFLFISVLLPVALLATSIVVKGSYPDFDKVSSVIGKDFVNTHPWMTQDESHDESSTQHDESSSPWWWPWGRSLSSIYDRYMSLSQFDESLAQSLGYYAYIPSQACNVTSVKEFNCMYCKFFPNTKIIDVHHDLRFQTLAVVFLDEKENTIIVSYRATWSTLNWLENLDFFLTPVKNSWGFNVWGGVRVHWGFYWAVKHQLQEQVYQSISNLRRDDPTRKLYITGISMGAAQASLASLDLVLNGHHVDAVYTYGSPRCGNKAFVKFYMEKMTCTQMRVTDYGDNVPYMPFKWMGGYEHVPHERYLTYKPDGEKRGGRKWFYEECDDRNGVESSKCHNSVPYKQCNWTNHVDYAIRFPQTRVHKLVRITCPGKKD